MTLKKFIEKKVKSWLNTLPYVRALYQQSQNSRFPNGHFYSPVISIEQVKQRENEIWKPINKDGIEGIHLNEAVQKELLSSFKSYYTELPFSVEHKTTRYHFNNNSYSYTDGIVLYSMIRHFKPKHIIEIGSGYTSALMLDVSELFFNYAVQLTFIDPYIEKLKSLMKHGDYAHCKIIESDAQQIPLSEFQTLASGDILFIDSTHVSKTGSDVNYIVFEILPVLQSGVIIHFHDVFYPFEYPKEWVFEGRNWNEDYLLRAFLMHNEKYEIICFADYLHKLHPECFAEMPLCYKNQGGNLWLVKK